MEVAVGVDGLDLVSLTEREADLGLAGGNVDFLFFKKGEPVCRISEEEEAGLLRKEIGKLTETD